MNYDPSNHHRRSIRLKGYDYSIPGAYFISVVVKGRVSLFGEISGDRMVHNAMGLIVQKTWMDLPSRYAYVEPDVFIVMPNHFHEVLIIRSS